jgi:branched-chain amino acid transport system substrate-binding protein
MKRFLLLLLSGGLLGYGFYQQWNSFDRMAARRFQVLSRPAKEILVGVCWPFSVNQDGMADGLQLALSEINGGHLTGGLPIRLIVRDDDFNWEKGKRIAVEFSNTPEMSAVIGYYDDSIAIKASTMFESSRLLHLIIGANNTAMTDRGFSYIVRTTLASDTIAASLARMSAGREYRKYALLWEDAPYGQDLAYQYHISMDGLNTELLYQRSYPRERADFRLIVNQLKEIQADVIFFAGLEPWAGDFLRAARGVGITTPIIGAFSDTPEMRSRAGAAIEGAMYFEMYDVNSPTPQNQEFVRKFRARFGHDPDTWAAQAYDALYLLAKAVRATGSVNPLDLSYAIRYMAPWEGANGPYRFDGRGELADKSIYLNVIQNGKPVTIQESRPETVQTIQ